MALVTLSPFGCVYSPFALPAEKIWVIGSEGVVVTNERVLIFKIYTLVKQGLVIGVVAGLISFSSICIPCTH